VPADHHHTAAVEHRDPAGNDHSGQSMGDGWMGMVDRDRGTWRRIDDPSARTRRRAAVTRWRVACLVRPCVVG
jgi:hypothetical protein